MQFKSYFTETPVQIVFEKHDDGNWVWLRDNIEEVETEEGTQFVCDEVFFKTGATKEEITSDFNSYFEYGKEWKEEKSPTIEERVSAVEDALLEILG